MPIIPAACPCGDVCAVCHPAYQAGGTVRLISSPPGGVISGAGGYSAGGRGGAGDGGYARRPWRLYGTTYPSFSTWYSIGREVPEVVISQAQARETAREAERQQAEYARICAEQDLLRAAAREQAEELLLRWLSPEQERDYRERGRFDVTGSDGRRWRILCQGQVGNVQLLDDRGEWAVQYCAHPRGLPDPAAWLAQAMAVAHNAAAFIAVANVYSTASREAPATAERITFGGFEGLAAALRGLRGGSFR
jgi:hypothetical protein